MNISIIAPEISPYNKVTRLADNIFSLILQLHNRHTINAFIPIYNKQKIKGKLFLEDIPLGFKVYQTQIENTHATLYQITPTNFDYILNNSNSVSQLIHFNKAVNELLKNFIKTEIAHCFSWQTAILPLLIKNSDQEDIKTIFSFNGLSSNQTLTMENLISLELQEIILFELNDLGDLDFLKIGFVFSDALITTSRFYSQEIQSAEKGNGYDQILQQRNNDLFGIMNGVHYGIWNPVSDPLLTSNYTKTDLSGKKLCKGFLQKKFNLEFNTAIPIFLFGCRLIEEKGTELILRSIEELVTLPIQLLIVGTGTDEYHMKFSKYSNKFDNLKIIFDFNDELARIVLAGVDFAIFPANTEPGGIAQLFAMRYGCIPIAYRTGGYLDSITDISKGDISKANGFFFYDYDVNSLISVIKEAIDIYHTSGIISRYIFNGMHVNWSWKQTAKQIEEVYNHVKH